MKGDVADVGDWGNGNLSLQAFPAEVVDELRYYVYRLIDPRNGETFYVGKGKGNRVFAHCKALENEIEDEASEKLTRIREIINTGFEVGHVIHRHGMDEKTAFEVEAALIDAYPGLSNLAGGFGNADRGVMHADEIIERYQMEEAKFEHKALLINVNHSSESSSLYEATRYAWKISVKKAKRADVVLAVTRGTIIGAFFADDWLPADEEHFPGREAVKNRYGFVGRQASREITDLYCRKRLPDQYLKRGASNPIKYTYR